MNESIVVRESNLLTVAGVGTLIPEFVNGPDGLYSLQQLAERIAGKRHLIIVAYCGSEEAGYIVAYEMPNCGSFYCWMAGVIPEFRQKGILKAMMDYLFQWAKNEGYVKIQIKTRNSRRAMLSYLVKYGFFFTEVIPRPNIQENRILLEKPL